MTVVGVSARELLDHPPVRDDSHALLRLRAEPLLEGQQPRLEKPRGLIEQKSVFDSTDAKGAT